MKRALERYREAELTRRAREEGRREAREEMLRDVARERERLAREMESVRLDGETLADEEDFDDEDIGGSNGETPHLQCRRRCSYGERPRS